MSIDFNYHLTSQIKMHILLQFDPYKCFRFYNINLILKKQNVFSDRYIFIASNIIACSRL